MPTGSGKTRTTIKSAILSEDYPILKKRLFGWRMVKNYVAQAVEVL